MKNKKTLFLAQLSILVAILLLMSFTPLGYLRIFALEITFLVIPVAVGAIALGPLGGGILGAVFGLTSFFQAFSGVLGAALLAASVPMTFIVCFVPRVLVGLITGFVASKLNQNKLSSFILPSLIAPIANTVLFVGSLFLFFWNIPLMVDLRASQNVFAFFVSFVGINAVVEIIVCSILSTAITKVLSRIQKRS
ncbi:ECF transporter S component [Scatolibacter rhodanostii]|uniref:ECF transporter S component n=1 Tax=Scatolibacter rhodanostii TaxID=2014781 RepID=UPI000C06F5F7|nr:ECF transporter S component [Scatolibacter rhodanostii]